MTTRQSTVTPRVPNVESRGCTVACMAANGEQLIFTADSQRHAAYSATVLRGLLAEAFMAGKLEASTS